MTLSNFLFFTLVLISFLVSSKEISAVRLHDSKENAKGSVHAKWNNVNSTWKNEIERHSLLTSRISGGYEAPMDIAYSLAFVHIEISTRPGFLYTCVGSILSSSSILTAANCFKYTNRRIQVTYVRVGLGALGLRGTLHEVRYVDIFRGYNPAEKQNDIAIITVTGSISSPFKPITLPSKSFTLQPGTTVYAAGFGRLSQNSPPSLTRLLETKLMNQDYNTCFDKDGAGRDISTMPESVVMCATDPLFPEGGTSDFCDGDIGAPLYIKSGSSMVQQGIASFGRKCGIPGSVGWYTKLSPFVGVVLKHMSGNLRNWIRVYGWRDAFSVIFFKCVYITEAIGVVQTVSSLKETLFTVHLKM